jgi:glycosyltransferase involved in cell wall biosynthesis
MIVSSSIATAKQSQSAPLGTSIGSHSAAHIEPWAYTASIPTTVRVSVVIPALNEAENLPHVLPRIPDWIHEVLLVDGHSTDGTVELARRLRPSIRIVQQQGCGKGAALRSGCAVATGDIIVMLDADGSTNPTEIPAFVGALLAGADFVKGSRFLQGAGTVDMPMLRKVGNAALVMLANVLFRTHFTDITYGYNAVWRCHKQQLALEIDDWSHEVISNIRVAVAGLRVVEVACFEDKRIAGEAKLKTFSAGWQILRAMLRERLVRRTNRLARAARWLRDSLRSYHRDTKLQRVERSKPIPSYTRTWRLGALVVFRQLLKLRWSQTRRAGHRQSAQAEVAGERGGPR